LLFINISAMAQCLRRLIVSNYTYKLPCQKVHVTILPSSRQIPVILPGYHQTEMNKYCECCSSCCCYPKCKNNMPIHHYKNEIVSDVKM